MQLLVLHLSDIHVRSRSDAVLSSPERIARAVGTIGTRPDVLLLLLTGDLTYSGEQDQIEAIRLFIDGLRHSLQQELGSIPLLVEICPGNHDCDFSGSTSVRDALLNEAKLGNADLDTEFLQACSKPLEKFFKLQESLSKGAVGTDKVCRTSLHKIGNEEVAVYCYNTAWASQKNEKYGELLMPEQFLPTRSNPPGLAISLFHHPYGWLTPSQARHFREHIESRSDIVLTGHEHELNTYTRTNPFAESNTDYYEGGCLQHDPSNLRDTSLNVIEIDTSRAVRRLFPLTWDESERFYRPTLSDPEWLSFVRNASNLRRSFALKDEIYRELINPGANFTHPRKARITILDLFVHPHLKPLSADSAPGQPPQRILDGSAFWSALNAQTRVFITGKDIVGKTTLARYIFLRLHETGIVPLIVDASCFSHADPDRTRRQIRRAFEEQYGPTLFDRYSQLPKEQRTIILDNVQRMPLNAGGATRVMDSLGTYAHRLVVIGNDISAIQELLFESAGTSQFLDYASYELLEFGNELKEALVEKWLRLGREDIIADAELERETVHTKSIVDAVLGKNLIPSCPLYILILLQQIEAYTSLKTANASEGYLYEFLITRALGRAGGTVLIDTAYTYLSLIADEMFNKSRQHLTAPEIRSAHRAYCREYQLELEFDRMMETLITAEIVNVTEHRYFFRYAYFYYYFVARHLRDHLDTTAGSARLSHLVEHIYQDDAANVLAFLTYLAKERSVVDAILARARAVLPTVLPATLEDDAEFFGQLIAEIPKRVFEDRPSREVRREVNKRVDREDQKPRPHSSNTAAESAEINVAFKSVQILGQLIRNFPGSLPGQQKKEIAKECYLLGLRTLSSMLEVLKSNQDPLVSYVSELVYKHSSDKSELSKKQATKSARKFLGVIIDMLTVFVIKRIANAVGSETLRQTHEAVRAEGNSAAFNLIDIAIKLDHFSGFPMEELEEFAKRFADKALAISVLRDLVVIDFYRFPRRREIKQEACDRVGLQYQKVVRLEQARTKFDS